MTDQELAHHAAQSRDIALLAGSRTCTTRNSAIACTASTNPALFLRGEHDGLISAEYMDGYAGLLPNARTLTRCPSRPCAANRAARGIRQPPRSHSSMGRPDPMKAWHFSETAYHLLPAGRDLRVRSASSLPNRHYDPAIGADLYHRYLDEWLLAEDEGLDIMLNEHHQTATCVDPAAPLMLAVLARQSHKARLLIFGNPIANRRQPVRVAEEMAMIDVLSRGRLEAGFVRGVPYEISPPTATRCA